MAIVSIIEKPNHFAEQLQEQLLIRQIGLVKKKLVKAKLKHLKIYKRKVSKGPKVNWGGDTIDVFYRYSSKEFLSCSGTARFGKQGRVKFNLCGRRLKISSTLPRKFSLSYWNLPSQQ